jgi:alpha-1,3-glucan synthase
MLRKGTLDNPMVWPEEADYSSTILSKVDGGYALNHVAYGADKFRYTGTYGQEWSDWTDYDGSVTSIPDTAFEGKWWDGQHIQVQYWSSIAQSATHMVHGDLDFSGQRRWPQLLARGSFNNWGFDLGVESSFENDNGDWSIPVSARSSRSARVNEVAADGILAFLRTIECLWV